jgi:hypothetical protein
VGIVNGKMLAWDVGIFERLPEGLFRLNKYKFTEEIHPVAKIKSALSKHFDILEATPREKGRVILFVCGRK